MNTIVINILIVGGISFFAAIILYWVSQKFSVRENPKIKKIESLLPNVNCGGCGKFTGRTKARQNQVAGFLSQNFRINFRIAAESGKICRVRMFRQTGSGRIFPTRGFARFGRTLGAAPTRLARGAGPARRAVR